MAELLRLIMDFLKELTPFRFVWTWQQGLYYFAGRYQYTTGPGLKLVFPWLCEVRCVSVVPEIETTPLQTVTLRDGKTLTYSASLTLRVTDAAKAWNNVGHYSETAVELSAGVISSMLAEEDPVRIVDPSRSKRANMLDDIREEINGSLAGYGLEVLALRLNNFALGVPTLRLLMDKSVLEAKH